MSSSDAPPAALPTGTHELQDLVRKQATELAAVTAEKDLLLSKVEDNDKTYKDALQLHLDSATLEKDHLETSLKSLKLDQQERSETFKKQLKSLRVENDDQNPEGVDTSPRASVPTVLESNDMGKIKALVESLTERLTLQEMVMKKLKFELDMEVGHVNILRAENQKLRQMTVELQASAEQEEEYIANKLMKRINNLKKEKGELLLKVEQEEEMITNTLQKKLSQLQKEKIDMEVALEQEQEFIVNRLQKQLESLRLQQNTGVTSRKASYQAHSPQGSLADFPASPGITEVLRAEINALKIKSVNQESDLIETLKQVQTQYTQLKEEVVNLRTRLHVPTDNLDTQYPSIIIPVPRSPSTTNFGSDLGSLAQSRSRSTSEHSVSGIECGIGRYGENQDGWHDPQEPKV